MSAVHSLQTFCGRDWYLSTKCCVYIVWWNFTHFTLPFQLRGTTTTTTPAQSGPSGSYHICVDVAAGLPQAQSAPLYSGLGGFCFIRLIPQLYFHLRPRVLSGITSYSLDLRADHIREQNQMCPCIAAHTEKGNLPLNTCTQCHLWSHRVCYLACKLY